MTVHAVVVGSLVMDLAFRIPRRPQTGQVVLASAFKAYRGGKGYNQAVALARLGARVTMVGAVGGDLHGDDFLDGLDREGIDATRVMQMKGTPTAVAVPLVTPDGRAAFVQYPGASWRLSPGHCADLPDCDVVLLQGEVPGTTSAHVAASYVRRGTPVHLHPSPIDEIDAQLLNAASLLTPSRAEAAALAGLPEDREPVELAQALAHDGLRVVVSDGAGEVAWAADGEHGTAPGAADADIVDSTASRDAVVAALAIWLAEGAPFPDAVRLASTAGQLAAATVGAEPSLPQRAQVRRPLPTAGDSAS